MTETRGNSLGVMQPYVFPYIGYFQLIHGVDSFVFYDDVRYIKGGWINRNRISNRGQDSLFTVPAVGVKLDARIMDVTSGIDGKWLKRMETTLVQEYGKSRHFTAVSEMVMSVFEKSGGAPISELGENSIAGVFEYLGLPFSFVRSSEAHGHSTDSPRLRGTERIISITRAHGASVYLNLPGGATLYQDEDFARHGIDLKFIVDKSRSYKQFGKSFLPKLSIIDVLMHNDIPTVREMMTEYAIEERSTLLSAIPDEAPR